jgi:hypothetical protein
MDPIIKLSRAVVEGNDEQIQKVLKVIEVEIKSDEKEIKGK